MKIVEYYSSTCSSCSRQKAIVEKLAQSLGSVLEVEYKSIDDEKNKNELIALGSMGVPTLFITKNESTKLIIGLTEEDKIIDALNKL